MARESQVVRRRSEKLFPTSTHNNSTNPSDNYGKMLGRLVSGLLQVVPKTIESLPFRGFGGILNGASVAESAGGSWSLMPIRTRMRYHFPIARETKRIKVSGWKKRMSTPEGRRIIMRRILKGRYCLAH